jgi:CDP-diacylglycerol--serine O-phosphatidyltransferase
LNTSSQFGVELDSLADIVSFGAAPSILIYQSHLYELDILGILISSLILVFGAFRLARFNVQLEDISVKIDFKGLPIPVSAITIALMVISFYKDGKIIDPYSYLVIPLILILSFLMVSNVRYNALPKLTGRSVRDKVIIIILLIIALIVVLATNGVALFFIFLAFVLFGILRHIFYMIFPDKNEINNVNEETN